MDRSDDFGEIRTLNVSWCRLLKSTTSRLTELRGVQFCCLRYEAAVDSNASPSPKPITDSDAITTVAGPWIWQCQKLLTDILLQITIFLVEA
jgi:hypothetical protein